VLGRSQAYIHRVTCVDQQTQNVHDGRDTDTLFVSKIAVDVLFGRKEQSLNAVLNLVYNYIYPARTAQ
jgi:hypothetical protein